MTSNLLFVALLLALATVLANALPMEKSKDDKIVMTQERVDKINSMNLGFTAKLYPEFANLTLEQLRIRAGASKRPSKFFRSTKPANSDKVAEANETPFEFDFRQQWPNCADLGQNTDEGNCASSWAISVTRAIQYRECIRNGNKYLISAYDVLTCWNEKPSCSSNAAHVDAADFYLDKGIVTGGAYRSRVGCRPYLISPKIGDKNLPELNCTKECQPGYKHKYEDDKHKGSDRRVYAYNNEAVFSEIKTFGPVVAEFELFSDFVTYKGGVYHHMDGGESLGYYYALIVGYGVDAKGLSYWRAEASFAENWGEHGTFRIPRAVEVTDKDPLGFESQILAVYP